MEELRADSRERKTEKGQPRTENLYLHRGRWLWGEAGTESGESHKLAEPRARRVRDGKMRARRAGSGLEPETRDLGERACVCVL